MAPPWWSRVSFRATSPDKQRIPVIEHTDVGPPAAAAAPTPLLFLHGLGGDHTNWAPQLDEFQATRRCVSWTMPGYGDSTPVEPMTWTALAEVAVRLLDQLDIAQAIVVGLSMGGMVAQQLAADFPDRVDRLVLVATSPSFGRAGSDFADRYLAARFEPLDAGQTPADLAPAVVDGLLGPEPHGEARDNCITSMSRISSDAYRRALGCLVTWAFDDQLHRITTPTLCIAGADDRTAPPASLQRLADGITDSRLEVLDRCGHLVNLEQPAAFNALLSDFATG